jgi:hypothetical protein
MRNLSYLLAGTFFLIGAVAAHEPDTMSERAVQYAVPAQYSPPVERASEIKKTEQFAMSVSNEAALVNPATQHIPLTVDDPFDASSVAYDLTMTWMKTDEWQQKVTAFKAKFQDWENTNGGDIGQYLNDRLILVAMGCANGRIDSLKNGFVWLAYYKEFNQQLPSIVSNVMKEHHASLTRLFKDFTWEKASQYVKNKEWRKDADKKQ